MYGPPFFFPGDPYISRTTVLDNTDEDTEDEFTSQEKILPLVRIMYKEFCLNGYCCKNVWWAPYKCHRCDRCRHTSLHANYDGTPSHNPLQYQGGTPSHKPQYQGYDGTPSHKPQYQGYDGTSSHKPQYQGGTPSHKPQYQDGTPSHKPMQYQGYDGNLSHKPQYQGK